MSLGVLISIILSCGAKAAVDLGSPIDLKPSLKQTLLSITNSTQSARSRDSVASPLFQRTVLATKLPEPNFFSPIQRIYKVKREQYKRLPLRTPSSGDGRPAGWIRDYEQGEGVHIRGWPDPSQQYAGQVRNREDYRHRERIKAERREEIKSGVRRDLRRRDHLRALYGRDELKKSRWGVENYKSIPEYPSRIDLSYSYHAP